MVSGPVIVSCIPSTLLRDAAVSASFEAPPNVPPGQAASSTQTPHPTLTARPSQTATPSHSAPLAQTERLQPVNSTGSAHNISLHDKSIATSDVVFADTVVNASVDQSVQAVPSVVLEDVKPAFEKPPFKDLDESVVFIEPLAGPSVPGARVLHDKLEKLERQS